MKTNPLVSLLAGVLLVGALATFAIAGIHEMQFRKLRVLRAQVQQAQNLRTFVIPALAAEAVEYAKRNPAMEPLLQAAGILPAKPAAPSAAKPQAK